MSEAVSAAASTGGGSSAPAITLLTDFGVADGYVAAMKGSILSVAPTASIVDVTHDIPPQDTRRGGLVWSSVIPHFPPGTIHVGVVDPGVGTKRRILCVETSREILLVPDNGMIGYAVPARRVRRVVSVREELYFSDTVSATFHGRDIFAPVAARLSLGLDPGRLGPTVKRYRRDELPRSRRRRVAGDAGSVDERGEIVLLDRFGNAMMNLGPRPGAVLEWLEVEGARFDRVCRTFGDVAGGRPLVLVGSTGRLEIAVNGGNAAAELGISVGDSVRARWRESG